MSFNLSPQNSPIRRVVKDPINCVVDALDKHCPWVTPNMITLAGTAGVLAVDALAVAFPNHAKKLVVPYTIFSLFDCIDGAKAKRVAEANGGTTSSNGAILDTLSDRVQELGSSLALSFMASDHDDALTSGLLLVSGATSSLPALLRARAEASNVVVPENSLGTRPVRATMYGAGLFFHDNPALSRALGAGMTALNARTAYQRSQALDEHSPHRLGTLDDPKKVADAKERYGVLRATAASALFSTALALVHTTRKPEPVI